MHAAISRLFAWGADLQGSTRPVALIRIGVAVLLLVLYADEVALFRTVTPIGVVLGAWFFAAVLMMLVGWRTHLAVALASIALVTMYFVIGASPGITGWNHHHSYLLMASTLLLNFTPCGMSYSVDRLLAVRRAERDGREPPPERASLWAQRLLGLQLSAIYFWTAIDKSDLAFVSGERLEQTMVWIYANRPLEAILTASWFTVTASVAVLAIEYFLAFGIQLRRLQPYALPLGAMLHLAFYVLLPVTTYSANMVLLYLAVLDPDAVHRFIDRLQGHHARSADPHRL